MTRPWGTGSITREGDGHRARLPARLDRRNLGLFETEEAAAMALTAALEMEAATPSAPRTLNSAAEEWFAERETRLSKPVRASVNARDRSRWATYTAKTLGLHEPHLLTAADVTTWWKSLRSVRHGGELATQSKSNLAIVVRGVLAHAGRADLDVLEIGERDHVATHDAWDWLRQHEILRVLGCQAIPLRARCIFAFAIYTGLRAGELWGLRWVDVDLGRNVVTVRHSREDAPKNGKPREIAMLGPARAALELWAEQPQRRSDRGLVWPAVSGGCHADGYDAGWSELRHLFRLGRSVRFHDLRHTHASHLLQGTWAPELIARPLRLEEVRDVLGHADIAVTQRYAHLCADSRHALVVRSDDRSSGREIWTGHQPHLGIEPRTYGLRNRGGSAALALVPSVSPDPSSSPSSLAAAVLATIVAGQQVAVMDVVRVCEALLDAAVVSTGTGRGRR